VVDKQSWLSEPECGHLPGWYGRSLAVVLDQTGSSEELIFPSLVLVAIDVMDAHPSVRAATVGGDVD
jgi:hypothetical protein